MKTEKEVKMKMDGKKLFTSITSTDTKVIEVSFSDSNDLKEELLDAKDNGIASVSDKFDSTVDSDFPESLVSNINSSLWKFIKDEEELIQRADSISPFEITFMVLKSKVYFVFAFKHFYNGNSDFEWCTSELCCSEQRIEETGGWGRDPLYSDPVEGIILELTLGGTTVEITIDNLDYKTYQT